MFCYIYVFMKKIIKLTSNTINSILLFAIHQTKLFKCLEQKLYSIIQNFNLLVFMKHNRILQNKHYYIVTILLQAINWRNKNSTCQRWFLELHKKIKFNTVCNKKKHSFYFSFQNVITFWNNKISWKEDKKI